MSVDFHWLLNTLHGADYFRRWHSHKEISGGLMIHKATHHFDLVNWWLGTEPEIVQAYGKREFYTPAMAKRMGLESHHERCLTCPEKQKCTFYLDIGADANFKELYLDNEKYDGYFRDRCVFRPDINIEDTMNVIVKYKTGATLSLLAERVQCLGGLHDRVQRHQGAARASASSKAARSRPAPLTTRAKRATRCTTRIIPLRGKPAGSSSRGPAPADTAAATT